MTLQDSLKTSDSLMDKWLYSACTGCMQSDCSTRVHVKDGVVVGMRVPNKILWTDISNFVNEKVQTL